MHVRKGIDRDVVDDVSRLQGFAWLVCKIQIQRVFAKGQLSSNKAAAVANKYKCAALACREISGGSSSEPNIFVHVKEEIDIVRESVMEV
jgi:hypothetical protein